MNESTKQYHYAANSIANNEYLTNRFVDYGEKSSHTRAHADNSEAEETE